MPTTAKTTTGVPEFSEREIWAHLQVTAEAVDVARHQGLEPAKDIDEVERHIRESVAAIHAGDLDAARESLGEAVLIMARVIAPVVREALVEKINAEPGSREALEAQYGVGNVWNTDELRRDFEVKSFLAPLCLVRRRSDGTDGTVMFQHAPRFYYQFQEA